MRFPLWKFGKFQQPNASHSQAYQVLTVSPEFDQTTCNLLQNIAEKTSWRPDNSASKESYYQPVLAVMRLENNSNSDPSQTDQPPQSEQLRQKAPAEQCDWLLLRFTDTGLDDHFRPHTLQIEAAWCRDLPWPQIIGYLDLSAWPDNTANNQTEIELTPVTMLSRELAELSPPPRHILLSSPATKLSAGQLECAVLSVESGFSVGQRAESGRLMAKSSDQSIDKSSNFIAKDVQFKSEPNLSINASITDKNYIKNREEWTTRILVGILFFGLLATVLLWLSSHEKITNLQNQLDKVYLEKEQLARQLTDNEQKWQMELHSLRERNQELSDENQKLQADPIPGLTQGLQNRYNQLNSSLEEMNLQMNQLKNIVSQTIQKMDTSRISH